MCWLLLALCLGMTGSHMYAKNFAGHLQDNVRHCFGRMREPLWNAAECTEQLQCFSNCRNGCLRLHLIIV